MVHLFGMQLLYKAYACEDMPSGRFLLPGYPVVTETKTIKPGDEIELELGDGTRLKTTALGATIMTLSESVVNRFLGNAKPMGFYQLVQVANDFSAPGIGLGANVYLVDSSKP
jgi:hypothetical protein